MKDAPHTALVYGSSTLSGNFIQSDINLILFAEDAYCCPEASTAFKSMVLTVFENEGIRRDNGVPYERKLLIPISLAERSPSAVSFVDSVPKTISWNPEYMELDEMLHRLVFNVLTVPTVRFHCKHCMRTKPVPVHFQVGDHGVERHL
jgi:hypothetical protein